MQRKQDEEMKKHTDGTEDYKKIAKEKHKKYLEEQKEAAEKLKKEEILESVKLFTEVFGNIEDDVTETKENETRDAKRIKREISESVDPLLSQLGIVPIYLSGDKEQINFMNKLSITSHFFHNTFKKPLLDKYAEILIDSALLAGNLSEFRKLIANKPESLFHDFSKSLLNKNRKVSQSQTIFKAMIRECDLDMMIRGNVLPMLNNNNGSSDDSSNGYLLATNEFNEQFPNGVDEVFPPHKYSFEQMMDKFVSNEVASLKNDTSKSLEKNINAEINSDEANQMIRDFCKYLDQLEAQYSKLIFLKLMIEALNTVEESLPKYKNGLLSKGVLSTFYVYIVGAIQAKLAACDFQAMATRYIAHPKYYFDAFARRETVENIMANLRDNDDGKYPYRDLGKECAIYPNDGMVVLYREVICLTGINDTANLIGYHKEKLESLRFLQKICYIFQNIDAYLNEEINKENTFKTVESLELLPRVYFDFVHTFIAVTRLLPRETVRTLIPEVRECMLSYNGLIALKAGLITLGDVDKINQMIRENDKLIENLRLLLSIHGLIALRKKEITVEDAFIKRVDYLKSQLSSVTGIDTMEVDQSNIMTRSKLESPLR